jgi:hypothetical protein
MAPPSCRLAVHNIPRTTHRRADRDAPGDRHDCETAEEVAPPTAQYSASDHVTLITPIHIRHELVDVELSGRLVGAVALPRDRSATRLSRRRTSGRRPTRHGARRTALHTATVEGVGVEAARCVRFGYRRL